MLCWPQRSEGGSDNVAEEFAGAEPARDPARSPFERYDEKDVADLIRDYPLAWVCPRGGSPMLSTLLPLLAETDTTGRVCCLLGHLARKNPLFQALTADPHTTILFTGPQAYVSPGCVSDPTWAPTWNYAQVRIEAALRFEPAASDEALSRLLAAMEAREPTGWTPADMGARYGPMSRAIIAFRAVVTHSQARFKLGQDEKPERLREILARHTDAALVQWMRRFNAGRHQ
jgi:transcriptional regulator